uniref:Ig-like domain-containing protein n=1 Tax=Pundamilia nyererei TaxID=303518 RepID=A0A3B4ET85_9CICH
TARLFFLSDSDCSTEIRVRRNTVYNASAGQQLWINCPVFFCNDSPPTVTWYKVEEANVPINVSGDSHIKTEWKPLNKSAGIFYLMFQNILRHDSGQYQCQSGGNMGHAITVNVYGECGFFTNYTKPSLTLNSGLFLNLMIFFCCSDLRHLEPSQRGSPSAAPSRRYTKRKTPPRQPNEFRLSRDNEQAYGPSNVGRERQRNTVEEESGSVVYAALNHELPQRVNRPRMEVEETSEYAAIRLA